MRTFKLVRTEDFSGVSGTGDVAEGVEFNNGKVVMCWDTKTSSIAVYENVDDVVSIHGHEGRTKVVFDDQVVGDGDDKKIKTGDLVKIEKALYVDTDWSSGWLGLQALVIDADDSSDFLTLRFLKSPDGTETERKWMKNWVVKC